MQWLIWIKIKILIFWDLTLKTPYQKKENNPYQWSIYSWVLATCIFLYFVDNLQHSAVLLTDSWIFKYLLSSLFLSSQIKFLQELTTETFVLVWQPIFLSFQSLIWRWQWLSCLLEGVISKLKGWSLKLS